MTKTTKFFGKALATAIVAMGLSMSAQAVTIGFSSVAGGEIVFDDLGNFEIAGDPSFETDGGLLGSVTGVFSIGAITPITIGVEEAAVTGTGVLAINDGAGEDLLGAIEWVDIVSVGTAGAVNVNGNVNLDTLSYSGSNADLLALVNDGAGIASISFQLPASPFPLTEITTLGGSSSFSGTIDSTQAPSPVPDAGASILLLGLSLLGLGAFRKRA